MFALIQILAVMALIAAIIIFFRKIKHKGKSIIAWLIILMVISSVVSNAVLSIIPLPTDRVIVTALGEKNENASSNEVYITNLIVGGEEYEIKKPSEGKWFWKGDVYMWRNESDTRQPEGTTRSITISMPYGRDRSIQFGLSQWNGIVEVSYGDETQRYDLFKSSDETTLYAPVPDTASFPLYGIKLLRAGLFVLIIALLMAYPIYAAVKFDHDRIRGYFKSNWDKYYYISLALVYIVFLQKNSIGGSLWGDEIWMLGWFYGSGDPYSCYVVFDLISKLWLNIMPYGHEYLRLLSEIFVAGAIFFVGMTGREFKGKRFGVLLSSSVAFSLTIADQCAKGIRSYAMLLFMTSLMLYMFVKKQKSLGSEKISNIIIYSFVLALVMDTHQFGLVVAGLIMISDFVLIILKKSSKKCWAEFVIPGLYGIYWLIASWEMYSTDINNYGIAGEATVSKLFETIKWLFSYSNILLLFALLGIIIATAQCLFRTINHSFDFRSDYTLLVIITVPVLEILLTFLYSTVINPNNSLLIDRYFIAIIIFLIFLMCYGIDEAIVFICRSSTDKQMSKYITIWVVLSLCIYNWTQIQPWVVHPTNYRSRNDDYKSVADYVMQQNDIYDSSTLLLLNHGRNDANIGFSYYLTHNRERDDINHRSMFHLPKDLEQYTTIYIAYDRNNGRWDKVIDEQYELVDDNTSVKVKKYIRK